MDRSFLSDQSVVAASRNFVCIRLVTYEDQAEADFMKTVYVGKSGSLENTVFAILSPDGKQKLTRVGRAPFHEYRNSRDMAAGMNKIASQYDGSSDKALTDDQLPLAKNIAIGLNVAASDGLPLIILSADTDEQLISLQQTVTPAAWSESIAGQFIYAATTNADELKPLTGIEDSSGQILIVAPGQFGMEGKVLKQMPADTSQEAIQAAMQTAIETFPRKRVNHRAHVNEGIKKGIDWKSAIPETDPESLAAKKRLRGSK